MDPTHDPRPPRSSRPAPTGPDRSDDPVAPIVTVPLTEDRLTVGRRVVTTGGLRLTRSTETREAVVDEPLQRDALHIERVRIDRLLEGNEPPAPRQEGDVLVIPVVEEVLVTERRLLLAEELRVHRTKETFHAPQRFALRRERMSVERIDAEGRPQAERTPAADDGDAARDDPPPNPQRGDTR